MVIVMPAIETNIPENNQKIELVGLTRQELTSTLSLIGVPKKQQKMRVKQLWRWIYYRGKTDFRLMSDLGEHLRKTLSECCQINRSSLKVASQSNDGTSKWVLQQLDGNEIETVHIPNKDRNALCVSSQVGCTLNCKFCNTGTQPLVRNLTAAEIVDQMLVARDLLGDWPKPRVKRNISNVVMMGMGEPLYNYENVAKALTIFMDMEGIALSRRAITLSTSGLIPMMEKCGEELRVNLAVSLHAVSDDIRNELVPLNRKYPIRELINACRNYPSASNARRITFEYVMLKGVNDSISDARELVKLIKGIPAKINLLPFNPWPGAKYECSSNNQIRRFSSIIQDAGYSSPIRTPRGQDIMAACGQLKSLSQRRSNKITVST